MSRKFIIILFALLSYLVTMTVVGIFCAIFSLWSFKNGALYRARYAAIVSRGALFPHIHLLGKNSVWRLTDNVLALVQASPHSHQHILLLTEYIQTGQTLDTSEISSLETFLEFMQLRMKAIEENLQNEGVLKQVLFSTFPKNQGESATVITQIIYILELTKAFIPELTATTNSSQVKNYLIIFQNNMELRPTGGFMGSYALLKLENKMPPVIEVQDIYVPDGQLPDHVEPPLPIQEAFQQGFWKLRDANWHPDFEKSANNVEWFFEEAMQTPIDGVVAVNFSTIQTLLEVLGPIYIPDFQQEIQPEDLYVFLQHQVETDFFPGSTKKKDVLSSIARQLIIQLQQTSISQKIEILQILVMEMKHKNIQFHVDHPDTQYLLTELGVTGPLQIPDCGQDCISDYFSIYEANLGVNKSNCCVERTIEIDKNYRGSELTSEINILWNNVGPSEELEKVAGDYKSYVRIYVPLNTHVTELIINGMTYKQYVQYHITNGSFSPITASDYSISNVQNLTEIGFWVLIPKSQTHKMSLTTSTIIPLPTKLHLQKQSGTFPTFNSFFVIFQQEPIFNDQLEKDTSLLLDSF